MLRNDSHIHTHYSKDADPSATFSAYIKKAQALGLTSLTFTDHHDIDPAHPLFKDPIDFNAYYQEFLKVQATSPLPIYFGVEVGYQVHVKDELKTFLKTYPFDHVILSIHYLEKKDLYTQVYFQGKTKKEAYQLYFETCLQAIQDIDDFDTFGHFDYIPRYAPFGDYDYAEFTTIIDQVLRLLIKKDKALEINTSGFVTEGRAYPKKEVIERYLALGGTKFTYGSDAHRVEELGRFFANLDSIVPKSR
jgi:histidinol-phosphatase (PHP family)